MADDNKSLHIIVIERAIQSAAPARVFASRDLSLSSTDFGFSVQPVPRLHSFCSWVKEAHVLYLTSISRYIVQSHECVASVYTSHGWREAAEAHIRAPSRSKNAHLATIFPASSSTSWMPLWSCKWTYEPCEHLSLCFLFKRHT